MNCETSALFDQKNAWEMHFEKMLAMPYSHSEKIEAKVIKTSS
jgi:hypothetical protein